MTNDDLKSFINDLNSNRKKLMHLRPISKNVEFAKVWFPTPKITDRFLYDNGPDKFYFIKNDDGKFIGVVYDMEYDLHWYISYRYRKKGLLVSALHQSILPHLFRSKKQITITIDKSKIADKHLRASEKVAILVGFKKINDTEYLLLRKNYKHKSSISEIDEQISHERMRDLQNQINYVARTLWTIQTEIEMKYGNTMLSREFIKLKDQIAKKMWSLEDLWYDENANIDKK